VLGGYKRREDRGKGGAGGKGRGLQEWGGRARLRPLVQCPANPHSKVDPDEWAEGMTKRPYSNGIGNEIQCREDYDALLEMEQMGGKIRDINDEYLGAEADTMIPSSCSHPGIAPTIPPKWLSASGDYL